MESIILWVLVILLLLVSLDSISVIEDKLQLRFKFPLKINENLININPVNQTVQQEPINEGVDME